MWRDALPGRFDRRLLGHTPLVTFVTICWIAACCVTHDLPLLTRNRKHFEPLEPLGLDLL
jgi:predicted nucleic acid-binding protein